MAAMFGLGLWELLIIVLCLGAMALPLIVAVCVIAASRRPAAGTPPSNPNLAPCPDCGRLVSIHAEACPQCGHPFGPKAT
jgi:hypothetical protein